MSCRSVFGRASGAVRPLPLGSEVAPFTAEWLARESAQPLGGRSLTARSNFLCRLFTPVRQPMRALNLGCGGRFQPDWENLDFAPASAAVRAHDLQKGIPFPDGTFDVVYHSHVLEHFPKQFAPSFLRECHRVLK